VIADDQGMVRAGLRSLLDSEVVGEAVDGFEAIGTGWVARGTDEFRDMHAS
jgi:DNA-binding NarL/FixJ family response regulator